LLGRKRPALPRSSDPPHPQNSLDQRNAGTPSPRIWAPQSRGPPGSSTRMAGTQPRHGRIALHTMARKLVAPTALRTRATRATIAHPADGPILSSVSPFGVVFLHRNSGSLPPLTGPRKGTHLSTLVGASPRPCVRSLDSAAFFMQPSRPWRAPPRGPSFDPTCLSCEYPLQFSASPCFALRCASLRDYRSPCFQNDLERRGKDERG